MPALIHLVTSQHRRSGPRRPRFALVLGLFSVLLAGSCMPVPKSPPHPQRIEVFLGGPVAGATVYLWWVDARNGRPLRKNATLHPSMALIPDSAVASGVTDASGAVVFDNVNFVYGSTVLKAQGGSYVDPWLVAEGRSPDDARVALGDLAMWSAAVGYIPPFGTEPAPFVISPMTTLAMALAERSLSTTPDDTREYPWYESIRDTFALFGAHLGDVSLAEGGPLPAWMPGMPEQSPGDEPAPTLPALDEPTRHGLILAAFPSLARQIAQAAGVPASTFHAHHLLALLLEDTADAGGLLDGIGPDGPLVVGVCELPDGCADPESAMCRTPCALDGNTLRADLATALAFDFLGSSLDLTGLALADVLPIAEHLRTNQAPAIFGDVPDIALGGPRPTVRVLPTTVYDELDDSILFDERGVPVHTTSAGARSVELGAEGSDDSVCPVLHKFTHRLDSPDDNPIRWEFEVADRRGAAIKPAAGMYRLRLRQSTPGERDGDEQWLTDWLPASLIESVADGMRYEVVLRRSVVPALGLVSGDIEIELRGADELGLMTMPARYCWQHVPLAPPLQVRNVVEAVGAGSLHEANLDPANNLAPLLNGVPLEQGRSVMDLEIVNGTAEAVYATFAIEQGLTTFTKSWQKTNARLFDGGKSDCLSTGDCTLEFPPDRRTVIVTGDVGTIDRLVSGVVVHDMATGQRISPCDGCDPDEYRIEPRITLGNPRVYRVRLVVTDLRALAPQPQGEDLGPFMDTPIDAEVLPTPITGLTFGRFRSCRHTELSDPRLCGAERVFQHYVSLVDAALSLAGVRLASRTSPSLAAPSIMLPAQDRVLGAPEGIEAYQWHTTEVPLPLPEP